MLQIREWCDEAGLKVKGVHATDGIKRKPFDPGNPHDVFVQDTKNYASLNEYNRLAGVDLIKNRIDLAHILDAGSIVLHFAQPHEVFEADKNYREQYYCQALKSFDELEYYCKTRRIRICIENTGRQEYDRYMFDTLFKRYDGAYMGLCFDTGHGNFLCKNNCLEFAERYNDRLFMIHIHDNQGGKDEHLIPFEGTFNWEGFAKVLAQSPYEFPLLIESAINGEGGEKDWLDRAFKAGVRFHEMVIKYRKK
jgi:sugar phosphate isomerase/epimerase